MNDLHVIIPAGGAGTRLWPLSRRNRPKFLLDLAGTGRTLLQGTVDRLKTRASSVTIVTGQSHRDGVLNQLPEFADSATRTLLIEPSGRRSFITTEGVEAEPQIEDLEHLELVGGDWVYATGYDLVHPSSSAVLSAWLLRLPQDVELIVDLGPVQAEVGDDRLRAVLARSTLLTGNHLEMTRLIERLGSPGALRRAAAGGQWV